MNESKISVRYAKAIFQTATQMGLEQKVMDDLKFILTVISMPDIISMLQSPVVKTSDKKRVFIDIFKAKVNPLTMNFLELLLNHNREAYTGRIARYYQKLYNEDKNIKIADITTPFEISKDQYENLRLILKNNFNSEIELSLHIKPEIIGGFILKVDDEQYDASVRTSLKRVKKELHSNL